MKKLIVLICFCCISIYANDAIPIINTVFHGINTAINLTRPAIVIQEPVVVQPTVAPVIVRPAPVIQEIPVVPTVVYPNGYYEVYPTYSYPRRYYYRGYYRPIPPPPRRYHNRGHRR